MQIATTHEYTVIGEINAKRGNLSRYQAGGWRMAERVVPQESSATITVRVDLDFRRRTPKVVPRRHHYGVRYTSVYYNEVDVV
jgi:hypothetical protein